MGKRDKEIPYEVVIQERKRVDLYGNVVYYIYWFDNTGENEQVAYFINYCLNQDKDGKE